MPGRVHTGAGVDSRTDDNKVDRKISAINSSYFAWTDHEGIHVQTLASQEQTPTLLQLDAGRSSFKPLLAFSPVRLNYLAASSGPKILIYDVETCKIKCTLKGNGRNVTCLIFAPSEAHSVITGTTDGSICVWSLETPARPVRQLRGVRGPCTHLSINDKQPNLLASCHGGHLAIWSLSECRLLGLTGLNDGGVNLLSWMPLDGRQLVLSLSNEGTITIMDFETALNASRTSAAEVHSDDDDNIFGNLEQLRDKAVDFFKSTTPVLQASLLGRSGLLVLPPNAKVLYFYSYSLDSQALTELWRLHVDVHIEGFTLRRHKASLEIVACLGQKSQAFEIPDPVLDGMDWSPGEGDGSRAERRRSGNLVKPKILELRMRPEKASRKRRAESIFGGTDVSYKPAEDMDETPRKRFIPLLPGDKERKSDLPVPRSMTSSLELPKERANDDENDSPIPSLSPSIPARKVSPGALTPLDESIQLPLPRASFDSISTHGNHDHDSDSDDETFAEEMQGSGSFLPGGLNVPLPSTCGAVFTRNGQLLTFFPSKPKMAPTSEDWSMKDAHGKTDRTTAVSRLFPSFGNLTSTADQTGDSVSEASELELYPLPKFAFQPSSFDSHRSWSAKVSPVKQKTTGLPGEHRVNVTVRNLETLTPTRRLLAEKYKVLPKDRESNSELCNSNAVFAADQGLRESAEAWRMLALILEQRSFDGSSTGLDGIEIPATLLAQRPQISRNTSMASSFAEMRDLPSSEMLQSICHPLGGGWAVERLFDWAESRADVQLLACMSAILARSSEAVKQPSRSRRLRSPSMRSDSIGKQLAELDAAVLDATRKAPRIPVLRTNSDGMDTSGRSPIKIQSSTASSNNPSQPTTPYLDSSHSTPPLTVSGLSRQASKLSTSGSASPEHHRSSFSTAARNYAASIAEKFSSYGSSPPTKKLGTSPNNELSSSLPNNQPSSWSKSVSFASTLDPTVMERRSLSLAQEDDDYDSDKTIDDASLPHTPKTPGTEIPFKMKQDGFFDETTTAPRDSLMSHHLFAKSRLWRRQYAEQLRSWDMILEAAEVEDLIDSSVSKSARSRSPDYRVVPQASGDRRRTICSICYCIIFAAEQLCPDCLHTTHPECLEDLFATLLGDVAFTCPTGCGCDCYSATDAVYEFAEEKAVADAANESLSFRKAAIPSQSRLRHQMHVPSKSS